MATPRGGMSRLLGLGFVFGAKDNGAKKMATEIGEGFDHMADAVEKVGKKSGGLQKLGNAIGALNFLKLDQLSDTMNNIADKAGVGPAASANSLESFGIQFGKTYREATAGMGEMGKEVDKYRGKISGLSHSLEVDSGDLLAGVSNIVKTGAKLADYGLTVRDMAGAMQANIIGGADLAKVLTGLSHSYGMTGSGAGEYLDQITALGQAHGVGKDAVQALSSVMDAADPILAQFPNMSFDNVSKSLYKLAIASQKTVGGSFQDNMQNAIGVFQSLAGQREGLRDLFTGLGGEYPRMAKEIGIASGDIAGSLDTVMSDPLTFAQNINEMLTGMGKTDPRKLRLLAMLKEMPANFSFFAQGGEKAAQAMRDVQQPIGDTAGAFSDMAKKASGSTRTFAEGMELMSESHDLAMRKIAFGGKAREEDRKVTERQRSVYKKLQDTLRESVKSGGVLGKFGEIWYGLQRHGPINTVLGQLEKLAAGGGPLGSMAGKLQKWVPMFDGLGDAFVEMGPALLAIAVAAPPVIGMLKGIFSSAFLLNPIVLGIAAAGLLMYANWDKVGPLMKKTWRESKRGLKDLWKNHLLPFARDVRKKLPAAFGKATELILISVASIKHGFKGVGEMLAGTIEVMTTGWELIASIMRNKGASAMDAMGAGMMRLIFKFQELQDSFRVLFAEFPLRIAQFMRDTVSKMPKRMQKWFGFEGLMVGLDKRIKDMGEGLVKAQDVARDTKDRQRAMDQEIRARGASRDRESLANAAAHNAAKDRMWRVANERMGKFGGGWDAARRTGKSVEKTLSTTTARAKPKSSGRRSRSAKEDMAKKAEASQAAATAAATDGGSGIDEFLMSQKERDEWRARELKKAVVSGIIEGTVKASKKRPIGTPAGGSAGRGGM